MTTPEESSGELGKRMPAQAGRDIVNNPRSFDMLRTWYREHGANARDSLYAVAGLNVFLTTEIFPLLQPDASVELAVKARSQSQDPHLLLIGLPEGMVPVTFPEDRVLKIMGTNKQDRPDIRSKLGVVRAADLLDPTLYTRKIGSIDLGQCSPLTLTPIPDIPKGWGEEYSEAVIETPHYLEYKNLRYECDDSDCYGQASLSYYTLIDSKRGSLSQTALLVATHLPIYECGSCHSEFQAPHAIVNLLERGDSVLKFVGIMPSKESSTQLLQ